MYSRILLLLMLFIGTFTSAIAEEQGDSPSFLKGLTDKVTTSLKENVNRAFDGASAYFQNNAGDDQDSADEIGFETSEERLGYEKEGILSPYKRIANSNYVTSKGKLYWRLVEYTRVSDCIICPRTGGDWHYEADIQYLPVAGNSADYDLKNLHGFGMDVSYLTDGKYFFYKDQIVDLGEPLKADFNPDEYAFAGVRDQYFIVDDLVFYKDQLMPASGHEFVFIADNLYRDNTFVYDKGQILKEADPATFEVVNYYFAQDQHRVWHSEDEWTLTDIKAPITLGECAFGGKSCPYINNDEVVYYQNDPINGADAKSFEVMNLTCPLDQSLFEAENVEGVFASGTHSHINCTLPSRIMRQQKDDNWSRDKNNVYYRGVMKPDLDPASAELLYLGNELILFDDKDGKGRIYFNYINDSTDYEGFLYAPLTEDSTHHPSFPVLADANGFFQFSTNMGSDPGRMIPSNLCQYGNEPAGQLKVIERLPEDIAYGFEDDRFEYYLKTQYGDESIMHPNSAPKGYYKTTEDILAIKDYMIDKATGEKYVMFNHFTGCGKWDEVEAYLR